MIQPKKNQLQRVDKGGVQLKIAIIGYSGSGKSTLARTLSNHLDVSCLHIDTVYFEGNWIPRPKDEVEAYLQLFLATYDRCVIDGNYLTFANERFSQADLLIYLDFGRWNCYFRCLIRAWKYRNITRPDSVCKEKFDIGFQWWVLYQGRNKKRREQLGAIYRDFLKDKVHLHRQKDVDQFVKTFIGLAYLDS